MPTSTISALTNFAAPLATDVLPIDDVTAGVTKKVTVTNLLSAVAGSVASGHTGIASYAVGDLIYASGTTALATLADVATGSVLVSGGVGAAPAWSSSPTISGGVTTGGSGSVATPVLNPIGGGGVLQISNSNASTAANAVTIASGGYSNSSGTMVAVQITPTDNTTSTGAITAFKVNLLGSGVGNGAKNLADFQLASTSKWTFTATDLTINDTGGLIRAGQASGNLKFRSGAGGTVYLNDASMSAANTAVSAAIGTYTNSSGTMVGLLVSPTYNQTSTAGAISLYVNPAETAIGSGGHLLLRADVASDHRFSVNNAGDIRTKSGFVRTVASSVSLSLQDNNFTVAGSAVVMATGTASNSSGQFNAVRIAPTYNQTSTASATDLLINRTQTAVGSGSQYFIDCQVAGSSKFNVANAGEITVGGGTQVKQILSATATLDFASTTAQSNRDLTITVTGAAVGDSVIISPPASPNANTDFTGFVSATDTVSVRFNNYSSGAVDPASGTYRATVIKF